MSKFIFIDFEYNSSQEKHPELVCCSWQFSDKEGINNAWLYRDSDKGQDLANAIENWMEEGYIFVAYAVTAEARCFYALGIDPTTVKWIDLYLEFRQIRNCKDEFNYGNYYYNGFQKTSVVPSMNEKLNRGKDNFKIPFSMDACVGRLLGINMDSGYKRAMRDLILTCPEQFNEKDKQDILLYCDGDITYLPHIHEYMNSVLDISVYIGDTHGTREHHQLKRGEFAAHVAIMESTGIPLHMESVKNLRRNVSLIKDKVITDLVEEFYPFYVRQKKNKADIMGRWVDKYSNFAEFIETKIDKSIAATWKKTSSDRYSADDEYLKTMEGIPEIKAYRETRKILNQIKWFRVPDESKKETDLFDNIGSDGHMRTFFGIYGTQTARNAPAAKRFIFAMSAWLRCLIRPPEGYVVVELDYGAQEFAIAAIQSNDPIMLEAYKSGDPYLYLAKAAGAVPKEGTRETHPKERDLFKSTTLGLQYGMGEKKLAIKLSADMRRYVSVEEARKLIRFYERTYRVYIRYLKTIDRLYRRQKYLQLPCGWVAFGDNPSVLSVRNIPPQGTGSSIIREAVKRIYAKGIGMTATLHDAVYLYVDANITGHHKISFAKIQMKEAFNNMLGIEDFPIRIDECIHKANEPWISGKGERYYHLLKEYLEHKETSEDRQKRLIETVFSVDKDD